MSSIRPFYMVVLVGVCLIAGFNASAQDTTKYYLENHPRFLDENNDTLVNAYAGGLYNPQFANYDLNNDGRQDLVVFDRQDHQVLTFLQTKSEEGEMPRYYRAPEYESQVPVDDLTMSIFFRDYNGDGRKDFFQVTSYAEVKLYKNVSSQGSDERDFELVTTAIQSAFPASNDTTYGRIYTPRLDISGFKDVDGDGDLDILAFGISGGYVRYYENQAVEKGKPLDSLDFSLEDRCWGCFNELSSDMGRPNINVNCNDYPRVGKRKHAGATMLPFDADNDGDMDLVYGDAGFDKLTFLENGRVDNSYPIDTFTAMKNDFPTYDKSVDIQTFPALFQVDINGDGVKDLIAAPQDQQESQNLNQVWHYKNTGTNAVPEYEFQRNDFLQNTMVDLGGYTHPVFYDYDQDGDQDLFVATGGNYGETGNNAFRIVYYENINTAEKPIYQKRNDDFLGLQAKGLTNLAPAFGDLNNNGRKDLVIGHEQGQLLYFENTGSGAGASFTERTNMLDSIDVGWSATPAITDIDGDGKNDLVIGTEFSQLHYYRNTGANSGNPTFELETDDFGGFDDADLQHIAPTFADVDGNDSMDLVLGTELDGLKLFYNIRSVDSIDSGDTTTHYLMNERDSFVYYPNERQERPANRKAGNLLTPAVANLDHDTFPDIMMGGVRGGLFYLGTRGKRDSITTSITPEMKGFDGKINFYPNPTKGLLQVNYEVPREHGELWLRIYDLTGRNVLAKSLKPGTQKEQISLSDFSNGLYSVVVANEQGQVLKRQKVVLRK